MPSQPCWFLLADLLHKAAGAAEFRRSLGIDFRQAKDVFYQAVSIKSVSNSTEFVREQMLEPFSIPPPIEHRYLMHG